MYFSDPRIRRLIPALPYLPWLLNFLRPIQIVRRHVDPEAAAPDPAPSAGLAEPADTFDFGNFRTALLREGPTAIGAALFRVWGAGFAEMPFVVVREEFRGKGALRSLLSGLKEQLLAWKVRWLVVPAAAEALPMWRGMRSVLTFADLRGYEEEGIRVRSCIAHCVCVGEDYTVTETHLCSCPDTIVRS